jgi:hypothetical protein
MAFLVKTRLPMVAAVHHEASAGWYGLASTKVWKKLHSIRKQ